MIQTKGYAGFNATSPLKPYTFELRELRADDVLIKIKYCGICHSDIHSVRNEWGGAKYPLVPGHEVIGEVIQIGKAVQNHKVGSLVGIGCMVNSCGTCHQCNNDLEQFCHSGATLTYNSVEADGNITKGGYADYIVVNEKFVLKVPTNLPIETVAPLLCAGITTYSPLKHWNVKKGDKVGIVGLGGLGHIAVKLAKSLGAEVFVFTTSANKKEDGIKLGANQAVLSSDQTEMKKHANSFDFILDTVAASHDIATYIALLKPEKTLCLLGIPPSPHEILAQDLIINRKNISGSLIGGIAQTQEMLDYCGRNNITSDVELIPIQKINEAYERVLKNDIKYRFVIDMQTL